MSRPKAVLQLTSEQYSELMRRVRSPRTSKRDHTRAQIVLACSEGKCQIDVASDLSVSIGTVNKWSQRFATLGLDGLNDEPGRGRKPFLKPQAARTIVVKATQPPKPLKRWSLRKMASEANVSPSTVHQIWKANGIKPHLTKTFKISNDPCFEEKFWDVTGLYLNPPDRALVLCCDEKSQCQALERTQPSLPLGVGNHIKTATHDYIRHGTITLFAALNYLNGKIIARTEKRHSHSEWLRFLKQIDRETPKDLDLHLIVDNYCTHKHEKVRQWLSRHPRFKIHFTPTSGSWMNLVERFFRDLTEDVIRAGSFASSRELIRDIEMYLANRNDAPQQYRWRADGEEILRKIQRAREVLQTESFRIDVASDIILMSRLM